MNENVTNKTPKRRRWVARLLVSAFCILLASSLLFVGVLADTITLTAQFSSSYAIMTSAASNGLFYLSSETFVYGVGNTLYFQRGNIHLSSLSLSFNRIRFGFYSFWLDFDTLYVSSCSYKSGSSTGVTTYVEFFVLDISDLSFPSVLTHIEAPSDFGTSSKNYLYSAVPFCVDDGYFYAIAFRADGSSAFYCTPFYISLSDPADYFISSTSYKKISKPTADNQQFLTNSCFYSNSCIFSLFGGFAFNTVSKTFVSSYTSVVSSGFVYEGNYYVMSEMDLYLLDPLNKTFDIVGSSPGIPYASYASNGVLNCFTSLGSNSAVPYTVYSGLPTTEPPPESSDETTEEPPPESSDDSSDEPVEGGTKIWKVDRGFVESYAGTIDLTNATEIRAFLGVFTSSGSGFASDSAVPLTLEVYRDGSVTPDSYTFDFYAYGWGVLGLDGFPDSYDSYTFPDVVGLYYEIPIPSDGEGLLFPTFAPYGSIYVNFSDSVYPDNIQRVTFNLHNSQGYLDVNFVSSSSTSFTIYNDDLTKGKTYSFDSGTFNYKCFFDLDGEYSETEWYSPQFGSSIKYYADDVLESGLYSIYSFNDESIEYPWGNGEWSDIILGNSSRLEDISADYALLESKANALYGNYKFDPLFGADFNDAVSRFNVVKDSSGGQTVLGFFNGMWSVHPFASSMIAIVGTLAIVGFIVRKL